MENRDRKQVNIVEENLKFFFDVFKRGNTASILIDTLNEIRMQDMVERHCEFPVLYFDLSKIKEGDSDIILGEIQIDPSKAVLFDNIDKIPKVQNYWLIEQMVKDALRKEESIPTLHSTIKRSVDFSEYHVGVRCESWPPEYLEGVSLMAITTELRKDYNEEDDE